MTHYERLGVAPDATPVQLRTAYRVAARRSHPDRAGDVAAGEMAAVNEAYRVLSDPVLRGAYDTDLAVASRTAGSAAPLLTNAFQS